MAGTFTVDVNNNDIIGAFKDLTRSILLLDDYAAALVPRRLSVNSMVMPTLVSDADRLEGMDPLAPSFALNAAKMVSRLTRRPVGEKLAVILRPCEIRAFVELVKLKQGSREDLLIIGHDCLGAYTNADYMTYVQTCGEQSTQKFYSQAMAKESGGMDEMRLSPACRTCDQPLPQGADLAVALYGIADDHHLFVEALTPLGKSIADRLSLSRSQVPSERETAVQSLMAQRTSAAEEMMAQTAAKTDSLEKLSAYLAGCVNCYNCRVACPVCYCRECVFVTDVFDHAPSQYLGWARRKGAIKMPTDTVFYHLTRMAHMSTACVGCGQCSNACPNEVPVMELFRTVAKRTQAAFNYRPGMDVADKPPLSEFKVQEFEEVVGID